MTQAVLRSLKSEDYQNWTWNSMILPKKLMFSKHQNNIYSSHYIIKFKLLSESDDLSGLIGSISHDDLNDLNDLDSLFDLKITKNASTLYTEWFSWPQPPGQPLFVGLIIKNPIFLWYLAPLLLEAVEDSLCHLCKNWLMKLKCPLLLNMHLKKNQKNYWSFYPSEPFKNGHFNVRHPVDYGHMMVISLILCGPISNPNAK